jgi:dynein light intermediate chain
VPFSLVQQNRPLMMGDGSDAQPGHRARGSGGRRGGGEEEEGGMRNSNRPHASAEVAEVLHTLLPPVTLRDARGQLWKQYCSDVVSSRDDVYQLQERLDAELIGRQARPYGICPVRELLYSQSFDELLRQVAIESPERGLMMLRVRDQLRMTIAVYQTLFHRSTVFGTRRAVMAETMLSGAKDRVAELKARNGLLQAQVYDLHDKLKVVEEREVSATAKEARNQVDEHKFLKDQIEQLRSFLRTTGALDEGDENSGGKKGKRGKKGRKKKGGKGKSSETRGAVKAK